MENIAKKGESACNNQFLLFSQCFQPYILEFAYDNFTFNENGRYLTKWVENSVGKGEIARDEQFLLFPQCFQKTCRSTADT